MARAMASRVISARGGCNNCNASWNRKNALALAAQHHDKTRHLTWAEVTQRTEYGAHGKAQTSNQGSML
jgi:hypothetical protein